MKKDYWVKFWKNQSVNLKKRDLQSQVLRTVNKKPINDKKWELTLLHIKKNLELQPSDIVLDLCCGNGLVTRYLAEKCKSVIAVDVSREFLNEINIKKYSNVKLINKDIRKLRFKKNSFSKVIIYAGIQYLSYKETIILFESVFNWLKSKGKFFLGDIPDLDHCWEFFNSRKREAVFFKAIKRETPIIGTWFKKIFLLKLANFCGFNEIKIINQHKDMINSHFRFDMSLRKY